MRKVYLKLIMRKIKTIMLHSKTVLLLSPIHKEGSKLCFIYLLIYDCNTLTSPVNVLNKNSVRSEGIQITLYFIMSSISLVRHCCFYENMVCINSIVSVEQKQTQHECDPILKCE